MMESGSEGELLKSKIGLRAVCSRRVMTISVLCTKCGNWVHGRYSITNRVTTRLVTRFVCSSCRNMINETVDLIEKLCDEVETVNRFCYLRDRLNASGGCKVAVTARVRIGWVRFLRNV